MTAWAAISDANTATGAVITQATMRALRDNLRAFAEDDSSIPTADTLKRFGRQNRVVVGAGADDGLSKFQVNHTSTLSTGDIASTVTNIATAALGNDISQGALASHMIVTPSGVCGGPSNPSYFVAFGSELDVPADPNNRLQYATTYAGKFITNFDSSATSGISSKFIIGLESELILSSHNTSGTCTYDTIYGFQVRSEPWNQVGGGNLLVNTYIGIYAPPITRNARVSIGNQFNLVIADTAGSSYFASPTLVVGAAVTETGAITHRGALGIRTEQANLQDAVRIVGRAGGSGGYVNAITVSPLSAQRVTQLPDRDLTITSGLTHGAVTQVTSRTTPVTLNALVGDITLVSAAGAAVWNSFVVNNSLFAVGDLVTVNQKSGTDLYSLGVTNLAAGAFKITYIDVTGTTTEQPVFSFILHKFTMS